MVNFCSFKKATCILIFSLISFCNTGHSQNLIDNWSFEDTVACPPALGFIFNSVGWSSYRSSPDYYNACNIQTGPTQANVSVPQNVVDFQYARTGNAYSGFLALNVNFPNAKEFLGTHLNQTLQVGQKYFVKFFVVKTTNHTPNYRTDVSISNIGVHFYTNSYGGTNQAPTDNVSQVFSANIISDTLNWTEIKGSFIADSNYQYVGIGNFFDINHTNYIQNDTLYTQAYYFVDDICISTDSLYCEQLTGLSHINTNFAIQIFPNPARDWIEIGGNEIKSLKFYDVSGRQKLSFDHVITPLKINISELNPGVYIIQIETKNRIDFRKIIKT